MSNTTAPPPTALPIPEHRNSGPLPLAVILMLVASGCAAMLNICSWFQFMQISSGAFAGSRAWFLIFVLGGLGIGALAFLKLARHKHFLRQFGFLHLQIALIGIVLTLWAANATSAALHMIPLATFFIGQTLPAIARWANATARDPLSQGASYSSYLAGALTGCLLAGFCLLPRYDIATTAYLAAAINLAIFIIALLLPQGQMREADQTSTNLSPPPSPKTLSNLTHTLIYITIAVSGLTALGAFSVWSRLLALLLAPTAFSYAIITAVFLAGLTLGSAGGTMLARNAKSPRAALAWCQALSCLGIGWSAWALTNGLTNWPVDPIYILEGHNGFALDFARTAWAILPATLCWGASFPLALAAITGTGPIADAAKPVGRVFAAQALGGLLGTFFFGLIAVKSWGTEGAEHILICLAGLAAIIAALSLLAESVLSGKPDIGQFIRATSALLAAICIAAVTIGILMHGNDQGIPYDRLPWELAAYGRAVVPLRREYQHHTLQDLREGQTETIAIVSDRVTDRFLSVDGIIRGSNLPEDLRLQAMLGHFPALFHPAPKKVLVIGCGTGAVAGSFTMHLPPRDSAHPDDVKIVICETEPLLPEMVANAFRDVNNGVLLRNPTTGKFIDDRVEMITDDVRAYLRSTTEKFDIITGNPAPPWVQGAADLQTKEYFELLKQHLNPGGLVVQWVPLNDSGTDAVKCAFKTFFDAFPGTTVWTNDRGMVAGVREYDAVLMGGDRPVKVDAAVLRKRMGVVLKHMLEGAQLDNPGSVLRMYAGQSADLASWVAGAPLNRDANLRLQYLAGQTLNEAHAPDLVDTIFSARTFPTNFLNLTDDQREDLERSWEPASPLITPETKPDPESAPTSKPN